MEQQQTSSDSIFTPDSSEARMTFLLQPYTLALILLIGFLLMEVTVGHPCFSTGDTHRQKGCEYVSLPTGRIYYFRDSSRSIRFIRPKNTLYGLIWRELKRLW